MTLTGQRLYLVVHRKDHAAPGAVRIVKRLSDAYNGWTFLSRISPIFPAVRGIKKREDTAPKRRHLMIFLGPVPPWRVQECTAPEDEVYITLGLYNILLRTRTARKEDVLRWAIKNRIPFEIWVVQDTSLETIQASELSTLAKPWRNRPAKSFDVPIELTTFAEEYFSLVSTTSQFDEMRGGLFAPVLAGVQQYVGDVLSELSKPAGLEKVLDDIGILNVTTNGLAQLEMQACRNISPILQNPSAPSSHSLLGLGTALRAVWNLAGHIRRTLESERLTQRFSHLKKTTPFPKLDTLAYNAPYWFEDRISVIKLTSSDLAKPLTPLIPYLNDCDHYRTTITTLSVPLNIINACNTHGWTLLTITHEMCHTIIRGVLAYLIPGAITAKDYTLFKKCADLYNNVERPATLGDELTRFLLIALVGMEHVDNLGKRADPERISAGTLLVIVDNWLHDAEEVMVHVLDCLYCYNGIIDRYVASIWRSWGVIPSIRNRIPEYVLRSLCAARATTLRHTHGVDLTYKITADALKKLESSTPYAADALKYLEREWETTLNQKLSVREPLIRLVSSFLYSKSIAGRLQDETQFSASSAERDGYPFLPLHFSEELIDNALKFVEAYTEGDKPSSPKSAWMLNTLAFNLSSANDQPS